jgi:hypothetical protein
VTAVPPGSTPSPGPGPLSETISLPRPGRSPRDLAGRLFRALYPEFELRSFGDLHVAIPKGTPWYTGHSLAEIACQISAVPSPGPDGDLDDQPHRRQGGSR